MKEPALPTILQRGINYIITPNNESIWKYNRNYYFNYNFTMKSEKCSCKNMCLHLWKFFRKLYYGSKESIYCIDIDTAKSKQLLYQKGVFFGPMTVDWITKNLYYTEIEWRGNITFYILKVMSVRKEDPNWIEKSTSLLWEFGKIHSLAVHPDQGYLFLSTFDNKMKRYRLVRLNADARNLTVHIIYDLILIYINFYIISFVQLLI
jgi:hypothetical protein